MINVWSPKDAEQRTDPFLVRFHYPLLILVFGLFALVTFGPNPEGLTIAAQRTCGIFVLCGLLWVTGLIPLQITSILAIILLPILDIMPSSEAFALFGNKAVFFILGAFILSAVLVDSGLSVRLSGLVLRTFSFSAAALRNTILLFSAFASFWMSEHAVAAMLFPMVLSLVRAMGLKPMESRFAMSFFFALAWGCVIGGIATYLGGARNPLAAGILQEETGHIILFWDWMQASLPLVIVMLITAWWVLRTFFKPEPVDMNQAHQVLQEELDQLGPMSRREKGVGLVSLLTFLAWIFLYRFADLASIALAAVAAMFVLRLTRWDVIEHSVNWGIILMYGGAIALGSALYSTGASTWMVDNTFGKFDLSPTAILLLLGALSLVLTELISNAAVVSVLMPVALALGRQHGIPLELITFAVALPSGLSYILPMGTPATAIAYGSGYIPHRMFIRMGPIMALLSWIFFALTAILYWPHLGYGL